MEISQDNRQPLALPVLIALCGGKLLLNLVGSVRNYGYFRDELYYLDLARHLDWGYDINKIWSHSHHWN
jgi:hypothetical protein